MPSSTPARRQLLAAAGSALSVAVAGCTGGFDGGSVFEQNTSDEVTANSTHEHTVTERPSTDSSHRGETLSIRSDDAKHFVYSDAETAADAADADEDEPILAHERALFITDTEDADALEITADETAEREIQAFVDDTDFEQQSVVIDQRTIEDCYERHLLDVTARGNSFRTEYCQHLKSPETTCEADYERMEAVVIRVDRPYNDGPTSRSSSESMSCHRNVLTAEREATNDGDDS
ncbi:hypothetical protein G6M89_18095 [Natronolimnobius sp. AArcel1]|uniref:hypothetical protein n=1 Tax=Natronolimnobius sp. AArcel1 TaxID=1679093 RepID=UPI0013EDEBF2|nr:hypothetical protein [Natronolimnobius sp. AArcel1]NGM70889.1 hypothetical protein [Natronolimnobius sp. AArcel1]